MHIRNSHWRQGSAWAGMAVTPVTLGARFCRAARIDQWLRNCGSGWAWGSQITSDDSWKLKYCWEPLKDYFSLLKLARQCVVFRQPHDAWPTQNKFVNLFVCRSEIFCCDVGRISVKTFFSRMNKLCKKASFRVIYPWGQYTNCTGWCFDNCNRFK